MGDFDEDKHPRDAEGRFAEGGGAGAGLKTWAKGKAPPALKEGEHFRELFAKGVSKAAVTGVLHALGKNPMVEAALKAHPLGVVTVRKQVPLFEEGTVAQYSPRPDGRGALIVQTEGRSFHRMGGVLGSEVPYGSGRSDQQPYSVAHLAKSPGEHIERVAVHEMGHHFHGGDSSRPGHHPEIDAVVKEAFSKGRPATDYAAKNHEEYFAETFAAHTYHPEELKSRDPVGHAMVEKVLKMRAGRG